MNRVLDCCKKLQPSTQWITTQVRTIPKHPCPPELVLALCTRTQPSYVLGQSVQLHANWMLSRLSTQIGHHNSTPSRIRSAWSTSTARSSQILLRLLIFRKSAERESSHKLPQVALTSTEWLNLSTARSVDSGRVPRDPIPKCCLPTSHTLMRHSVCNFWVIPSLLQHFPLCDSFSFSFASMLSVFLCFLTSRHWRTNSCGCQRHTSSEKQMTWIPLAPLPVKLGWNNTFAQRKR